jgi:signal transduction histidine kinase
LRRLSSLGRLALALALLATLWLVTVAGINRATDQSQERRRYDRVLLAQLLSGPTVEWLAARQADAVALAAAVPGGAQAAVDRYLAAPRGAARDVLVVDQRFKVVAASASRGGTVGRPLPRCDILDESRSRAPTADPVRDLISTASGEGRVSGLLAIPGSCRLGLVTVARGADSVVVIAAERSDIEATLSLAAGRLPADAGYRVAVVDSAGIEAVPGSDPAAVPSDVQAVVARASRMGGAASRYFGRTGEVVGAAWPLRDGWTFLLEQEAGAFDVRPTERPAVAFAGVLTAVFALVFALVAVFDVRRRRAARQAATERDAFLAIVGHELRTPLTVIKGYTETLASRWHALDDDRRQMLIEQLAPQTQRQARVIEHLMTAAALSTGQAAPVRLEAVDTLPILESAAREVGRLSPLHELVVHAGDTPAVWADAGGLEQVLVELVDNAVKFSPSGGAVVLSAAVRRRGVELLVEDDGVGLPADADRLFDAFTQAEDVDRRLHAEGGVGLGLYIARRLLEPMGGSVRAERRDAGGARFVVTLRLAAARDRRASAEARSPG